MAKLDLAINPSGASQTVSVVCRPHPFTSEKVIRSVPYGRRITEILDETLELGSEHLEARVFVDDRLVEKAYWTRVKPKAGHIVTIRVIPQGGGAQGKDILRMVAMVGVLALAVAATVLFPPLLGATLGLSAGTAGTIGSLIGSGVLFGGSLRLNSLVSHTPLLEAP